jgi:hypothetical protein
MHLCGKLHIYIDTSANLDKRINRLGDCHESNHTSRITSSILCHVFPFNFYDVGNKGINFLGNCGESNYTAAE